MKTQEIKWTDLTKVLKVGDTVYSSIFGNGEVTKILDAQKDTYPIMVTFSTFEDFTAQGFRSIHDKYPCITNIPFNPLTEPFPMPKFEPIPGEWYAFWDDSQKLFAVCKYDKQEDGFYVSNGCFWKNCAPIEEALEFFKSKNSGNEKATKAI